jgi:ribosomal protein L34
MQINVDFDTSVLDKTAKRYEKNLAYSVAQSINAAALEAQKRVRAHLREVFHIRRGDFIDRTVKVFAFASVGKDRIYAEIGIDNKPRLILSMFETGGTRLPFKGKGQAVPVTGQVARPNAAASVNPAYTFQALNFKRGPVTAHGRRVLSARRAKGINKRKLSGQYYVWQGANRTFILQATRRAPFGGVFQRVGPRRDDIRLIYSFKRTVALRKALAFVETSREAYERVFKDTFVQKFFRLQQP